MSEPMSDERLAELSTGFNPSMAYREFRAEIERLLFEVHAGSMRLLEIGPLRSDKGTTMKTILLLTLAAASLHATTVKIETVQPMGRPQDISWSGPVPFADYMPLLDTLEAANPDAYEYLWVSMLPPGGVYELWQVLSPPYGFVADVAAAAVPEPGTWVMCGGLLVAFWLITRIRAV